MYFYQHHISDFNNATRHLTRVERSLFSDAIDLYYDTEKPLIQDFEKLSRLLLANTTEEKAALRDVLNEFFILTDEGYFNKRCDKELQSYKKMSDGGKAGAAKRWGSDNNRGAIPTLCPPQTEGNANHEPITNNHEPITNNQKTITKNSNSLICASFDDFWKAYPKKVGKDNCLKIWNVKKPNIDDVMFALSWQVDSKQWCMDDGKYIPNPATYLNQGRWNDEPIFVKPVIEEPPF